MWHWIINMVSVLFSSAGWAYQVSWPNAVCESSVWMLTWVEQIITSVHRLTETCNLARVDLLTNPGGVPKTRSVWPTLLVKIAYWEKWARIGIFKPAEPHCLRDASFLLYCICSRYVSCSMAVCSLMWCKYCYCNCSCNSCVCIILQELVEFATHSKQTAALNASLLNASLLQEREEVRGKMEEICRQNDARVEKVRTETEAAYERQVKDGNCSLIHLCPCFTALQFCFEIILPSAFFLCTNLKCCFFSIILFHLVNQLVIKFNLGIVADTERWRITDKMENEHKCDEWHLQSETGVTTLLRC